MDGTQCPDFHGVRSAIDCDMLRRRKTARFMHATEPARRGLAATPPALVVLPPSADSVPALRPAEWERILWPPLAGAERLPDPGFPRHSLDESSTLSISAVRGDMERIVSVARGL
jgi:hypothetical protein